MDIEKLRTFLAVYRSGGMGKAADSLALTQPAVSQHIQSLESQLGHSLFKRTNKGIIALPTADDLAAVTAQHIDALQSAFDERRGTSKQLSGVVHLGAPTECFSQYYACCTTLIDAGLRLNVRLAGQAELYQLLQNDEVDIAITASKPQHPELDSVYLGDERLILVATSVLKQRCGGREIDLTLLNQLPFIAYDPELPLIKQYFSDDKIAQKLSSPIATCSDLRTLISLCIELNTWSVVPEYLARTAIESKKLQRLSSQWVSNSFYLVWKRKALRTTRVAFAQKQLKQTFTEAFSIAGL